MTDDESVKKALQKCAIGFDTSEVVEEFAVENGELKLIKKKVTKRDIPPDIKAVKMLLDGQDVERYTDEELINERDNLMKKLREDLND